MFANRKYDVFRYSANFYGKYFFMTEILNQRLAWLRKERGITLADLAGMINEITGAKPESKLFQTNDKVFTYERKTKPIKPKMEVISAYCKIFDITNEELNGKGFEKLNLFERWEQQSNVVSEPLTNYSKKDKNEVMDLLHEINGKLDKLLKVKK
jgi:hypothetical protein